MSRVQIILTPAGERLAIMPAEDYESLVAQTTSADEDRADLARIDEIVASTASGGSSAIALDATKRLLAGENPVRVWREARGLSQKDLAAKTGIGASMISMIESGERTGSPANLKRIATALEIELGELVS
jgi:ribosome-binding protein aMBF1 (putative translation factor)